MPKFESVLPQRIIPDQLTWRYPKIYTLLRSGRLEMLRFRFRTFEHLSFFETTTFLRIFTVFREIIILVTRGLDSETWRNSTCTTIAAGSPRSLKGCMETKNERIQRYLLFTSLEKRSISNVSHHSTYQSFLHSCASLSGNLYQLTFVSRFPDSSSNSF